MVITAYGQQVSKSFVFPLYSFSLDSDYHWLNMPFNEAITNDVRFVGLGEFSHGGEETIRFKSKMIQYLVEEKGYRRLMIEYPNVILHRINDYLGDKTSDSLDSAKLIAQSLFGNTFLGNTAFYDLMIWLKQYNLAHPASAVSLSGFDIEGASRAFGDYFMYNYLLPLDKSAAAEIQSKWRLSPKDSLVAAELIWFSGHKQMLEERLSKASYQSLSFDAKAAGDKLVHGKLQRINFYKASAFRDSIMASNIVSFNNSKVILWSHNIHLTTSDYVVSLGNYLHASVGKQYYSVLTDFFSDATVWLISNEETLSKKKFDTDKRTTAYILNKKFGINNGIVLFKNLKPGQVRFNSIDRAGNQMTLGKGHSFYALVILGRVAPFVFN